MVKVPTTAEITINVPRGPFYEWLIHDVFTDGLDTILKDSLGFAGVATTTGRTDAWDITGATRLVHLTDGTFSRETVMQATAPDYFAYRLTEFSSRMLDMLVYEARGQWWFTDAPGGGTHAKWTYTAYSRGLISAAALLPVMKILWNRSMRAGLERIKTRAEGEVTKVAA